ncbi:MAG: 3-deoxy-7-phosphoheptulonate synthase [Proteobacteria bacterium]|nr:3-deoxy-7-phosphoheptulonate synthase [Pseudomonadota bacterium]
MSTWHPLSFRDFPISQAVQYPDTEALEATLTRLRELPPLVTSWEVERLRGHIAEAQEGKRFILMGGDCAETIADCQPEAISNKMKILLQMSLVLVHSTMKPVVRVGRMAGQYAKPRSKAWEVRGEQKLPNYFGDLVNRSEYTPESRKFDPSLMLAGYHHAAMTLNFVRSLTDSGFADLHHPENWDLSFFDEADLSEELRAEYHQSGADLSRALRFMEALGELSIDDLTRVDFYTCHEGLNLHYESAQTHTVPRREGHYLLTTHLPWIGERTRQLDRAHVEFFRGINNPVGVKVGPTATVEDVVGLSEALNPNDAPGKLVLISRMGKANVREKLRPLLESVRDSGRKVLWVVDPMHGNTQMAESGFKTRNFDDICDEIAWTIDAHAEAGTTLGGVHLELTGEDVTECTGGAAGITDADLATNYATACDPRLNYRQALEIAFLLGRRMRADQSAT